MIEGDALSFDLLGPAAFALADSLSYGLGWWYFPCGFDLSAVLGVVGVCGEGWLDLDGVLRGCFPRSGEESFGAEGELPFGCGCGFSAGRR